MRKPRVRASCLLVLTALLAFVAASRGQSINVGDFTLAPNTPGQVINIAVTGVPSNLVQGLDLNVQINPASGTPGPGGPSITNVDIVGAGTLFSGNNTGQSNVVTYTYIWVVSTTTSAGYIAAGNGTIAKVTIDTTGFQIGAFNLLLKSTLNGDSAFSGNTESGIVPISITNGRVLVPEPTGLLLLGVGMLLLRRR